ncbi:hypothetical protein AUJ77_01470 [Candidatus Nomurabacteria bacterium CG1_02_43_90]|uniref:DUF4446 domain-containing protein n=1 Tax=Candidatus Nomurabacteria bacterium CG1_02_43_90 TaxID=1805281 RepID=A0A1J4V149_9BACT|nr:MAG: hypothetical protein AUJ77_01470 [Candidatus Nomurabacteria bacterium CG1_02_43_90]
MTPATLQIVVFALIAVILLLAVWLFIIERRLKKLLSGKGAQNLEGVIGALGADIRSLEAFRDATRTYLTRAEERLRRSVQGVETIRFNAFKGNGEGGNQSFAIALLSENGDGTVISSIYARERMSVFAKPIKNFSSEFEMSTEERQAVERAHRS